MYAKCQVKNSEKIIKERISEYFSELSFHNLAKVKKLYEQVLNVKINFKSKEERDLIFKSISFRHSCVHRNGKTNEGNEITEIDKKYLEKLFKTINEFVEKIDDEIKEL